MSIPRIVNSTAQRIANSNILYLLCLVVAPVGFQHMQPFIQRKHRYLLVVFFPMRVDRV